MKATEQYFHVVLFIMLYKVVLTFKSVDETLVCDHSDESYWVVLLCGTVHYAVQLTSLPMVKRASFIFMVKYIFLAVGHTMRGKLFKHDGAQGAVVRLKYSLKLLPYNTHRKHGLKLKGKKHLRFTMSLLPLVALSWLE